MANRKSSPFSSNLRAALAEREMTMEALAREIGVGLRTVQLWAAGDKEPYGANLVRMAGALRRSPTWFYTNHDDEPVAA